MKQAQAGYPVRELIAAADPERELAPCGLKRLILGSGTIDTVADTVEALLAGSGPAPETGRRRVALLVDATPILRAGVDVKDLVETQLRERFDVHRVRLDDGQPELHVVDPILQEATERVAGMDAVVALGGGTISDIGKVAAARSEAAPVLVTVQTAASVDGYTDDVSVVLRDGVKRTVPSRWPDAVIADDETIAEAPAAMNRAGYGEMTSMLVAPADWLLSLVVGADATYKQSAVRLLQDVGADLDEWSPGVREADPSAVASLTRALALRGLVTGVAGTTAVLSGMEHVVSHMLDQHHTAHEERIGFHGAQVGVAGVVAAAAWEMLDERLTAASGPTLDEAAFDLVGARERVFATFGPLDVTGGIAQECWRDYSSKLESLSRNRSQVEELVREWADRRGPLMGLVRSSHALAAGLRAAGAAATFVELDPSVDEDLARWAVAGCGLMRNRVNVVDLLTLLGWWSDEDVTEVFARAAAAVAAAEQG